MGVDRLELSTFRLSSGCSNQLSYTPPLNVAEESAARRRGPELNVTEATVITVGAADFHGFPAAPVVDRPP